MLLDVLRIRNKGRKSRSENSDRPIAREDGLTNDLSLRDFLSIPYLVEAETIDAGAGRWVRRAAHPEIPQCASEAVTIEDALERLERRRVERIVEILRSGARPPVPRPPLPDSDPEGVMVRLGFGREMIALLDRGGSQLSDPPLARPIQS